MIVKYKLHCVTRNLRANNDHLDVEGNVREDLITAFSSLSITS